MKRDELRAKLAKTHANVLARFLAQLAEEDASLRERIEALALREEPSAYARSLDRRLRRLRGGRSFISYRESGAFAHELEAWLDDVETGLLEIDPAGAWKRIDAFIRADGDILAPATRDIERASSSRLVASNARERLAASAVTDREAPCGHQPPQRRPRP